MWYNTTLRNDDITKELVQLLIVSDRELQMARDYTGSKRISLHIHAQGQNDESDTPLLLVVTGSVASELEDLGGEVFEHCGEVDGRTRTDTLGVVAALEHTVDTTDGELETGFRGAGCALGGLACCACLAARGFSGFALARLWEAS